MNKKLIGFPIFLVVVSGIVSLNNSNRTTLANDFFNRKIPDSKPNTNTKGAGSRDVACINPNNPVINTNLILLSPSTSTGTTIASHPTFLFYLDRVPNVAMRFSLVDIETAKTLVYKKFTVNDSGIIALQIPKDTPEMEIGQKYSFTVGLICSLERQQYDILEQVNLKRVEATSDNSSSKNNWYDELIKAYQIRDNSGDKAIVQKLLKQEGFTNPSLISSQISLVNWEYSSDLSFL